MDGIVRLQRQPVTVHLWAGRRRRPSAEAALIGQTRTSARPRAAAARTRCYSGSVTLVTRLLRRHPVSRHSSAPQPVSQGPGPASRPVSGFDHTDVATLKYPRAFFFCRWGGFCDPVGAGGVNMVTVSSRVGPLVSQLYRRVAGTGHRISAVRRCNLAACSSKYVLSQSE